MDGDKLTFDKILLWNVKFKTITDYIQPPGKQFIWPWWNMCCAQSHDACIYATRTGWLCSYHFFHTVAALDMTIIFRDLWHILSLRKGLYTWMLKTIHLDMMKLNRWKNVSHLNERVHFSLKQWLFKLIFSVEMTIAINWC